MRKNFVASLFAVVALVSSAGETLARTYTLLVAPARYTVMQVGFDFVNRYPGVLVSYQGEANTAEPRIHAWNGAEWVVVSLKDFQEMNFLQEVPSHTVLIGDDNLLPSVINDSVTWSKNVTRIKSVQTADIVNNLGRTLDWNSRDWNWFSSRYNLSLRDEAAAARSSSWYDQHGPLNRPPLKEAIMEEGPAAPPAEEQFEDLPAAPVSDAASADSVMPPAEPVASGDGGWSAPASVATDPDSSLQTP